MNLCTFVRQINYIIQCMVFNILNHLLGVLIQILYELYFGMSTVAKIFYNQKGMYILEN